MDYSPFAPTSGAVAYWIFIAVVIVAPMVSRYLRQREVHKTIRAAIQAGQPLAPEVLERLQLTTGPFGMMRRSAEGGLGFALVITAVGPAIWIISFFQYLGDRRLDFTMVGVGAAISMIGLVLVGLAAWRIRQAKRERLDEG